ncbi:hypothetical protein KAR91_04785 [Candidatus Pacearchaeota archaeon]|nr:hypothetical protein [Candidatus Pacearchaeota archaeon]
MDEFVNLVQKFAFNLAVLALPIIAGFVVALLKVWVAQMLQEFERRKPKLAAAIKEAVNLAVKAAEQANVAGFVKDKKQYAMDIAQNWLDSEGWDEVDIDILEAAVEAEVLKLFNPPPDGLGDEWHGW